jgi:hypothetical protein
MLKVFRHSWIYIVGMPITTIVILLYVYLRPTAG